MYGLEILDEIVQKDKSQPTDAEFVRYLFWEKGIGYLAREGSEKEKLDIGVIPLDAIFTPVERVSFKVRNMRVGKRTDFDRLNLEVETDGTISPEEAYLQSVGILVDHFTLLTKGIASEESKPKPKEKKETKKTASKKNEKKKKRKKT